MCPRYVRISSNLIEMKTTNIQTLEMRRLYKKNFNKNFFLYKLTFISGRHAGIWIWTRSCWVIRRANLLIFSTSCRTILITLTNLITIFETSKQENITTRFFEQINSNEKVDMLLYITLP